MDASFRKRLEELIKEHVEVLPYDPRWPMLYAAEEAFLIASLPQDLVVHIAHIGSTAIPGCSAKPVIDVQVIVSSLERVKQEVVPIMERNGYEFIWRPTIGEKAPFYAWFIKRNTEGERTHHIHMVEPDPASEDRLLFRDHLRMHPDEVERYEALKRDLALAHAEDRAAYTQGKSRFITEVVRKARSEKDPNK